MASIRIARREDDDSVVGLLLGAFADLYATMGVTMSSERERYLSDQEGRRRFATCLVHENEGRVSGTVTLVPPGPGCDAWIDGGWDLRLLAVDPSMQGGGIARDLLTFAETYVREAGGTAICLHTRRGVPNQGKIYRARDYVRHPAGDVESEPAQDGFSKRL